MDIVHQILRSFERVTEFVLDVLERGLDYVDFEQKLHAELSSLGGEVCKAVLEAGDRYLVEHPGERAGWQVERRDEPKTVKTPFGEIKYLRTYFHHKSTGKYAYLVDRLAGCGPHARVDAALRAQIVETSSELSYRKTGKGPGMRPPSSRVSAQTVMSSIRDFDLEEKVAKEQVEKRRCKFLYVEADEDHVASQKGKKYMPRLVYVHEGREAKGNRNRLEELHYFSGLYKDNEELWLWVLNYIEEHYDMNFLERIFVCGDGASWIKKGLRVMPKSVFVLDMFHLDKYLVGTLERRSAAYREAWKAVKAGDRLTVERQLKAAESSAETPEQKETARRCRIYVRQNWEGIMAYVKYPEADLGVSAEGHVSHVLSARLSSRPMAWSHKGVDQMSRMRAFKANGVDLEQLYLEQHVKTTELLKVTPALMAKEREHLKHAVGEVISNLPAVNGGRVTQLRRTLRSISHRIF